VKTIGILLAAAALALVVSNSLLQAAPAKEWPVFGYDAARHNASPDTTINAQNVSKLRRIQVHLDGTVDSSPIYVGGRFVVTTTYGKTEALDPSSGRVIWGFTPPSYGSVAGSARITNSTPAASTDRSAVYAAAPDGRIRKLRLSDGKVLWTTAITRDPTHEKMTSSINVSRGLVIATTGGYIGDAPPYQGHVVTMSERTGRIAHVWNSLCANRHTVIVPRTCGSSGRPQPASSSRPSRSPRRSRSRSPQAIAAGGRLIVSRASGRLSTLIISAASSTVRVIGPATRPAYGG